MMSCVQERKKLLACAYRSIDTIQSNLNKLFKTKTLENSWLYHVSCVKYQVSGVRCQVSGLRCQHTLKHTNKTSFGKNFITLKWHTKKLQMEN